MLRLFDRRETEPEGGAGHERRAGGERERRDQARCLLTFLESVPEVDSRLRAGSPKWRAFEDVVRDVEKATALVMGY